MSELTRLMSYKRLSQLCIRHFSMGLRYNVLRLYLDLTFKN